MRKIIAITQLSLDGVMQAPGGPEEDRSNDFNHGGWAMQFADDAAGDVINEIISGKFDMLLGRRTYDIFASYWPHHDDNPIGKAFNQATKYVVTHRPDQLPWQNSRPVGVDMVDELRRLKESEGAPLHIWGSSHLLQALIAGDLIDEFQFWIFPVVLGKGKRLFENGVPPRKLALVRTRSTPSGVLVNIYQPVAPLT